MNHTRIREKLIDEIQMIPDDKLPEIFDMIYRFRLGIQENASQAKMKKDFAGCWEDMSDELFEDYFQEIETRRRQAFSRRSNSKI